MGFDEGTPGGLRVKRKNVRREDGNPKLIKVPDEISR